MQRGLSKSVKKVVVKNHLQGMRGDENAKNAGSANSGSKLTLDEVSSVVKEFDSDLKEKGLDITSKEYGVSSITKELSEVARFRKESGLEFSSILEGSKIAGTLKKYGAGLPEFEQFLNSVYARSLEKGFTPNEIITQSSKLQALEKKYGMTFDAIKTSFDDLGKTTAAKKKEKIDLESEIAQISKRKADLMSRYSVDEKRIEEYAATRQQLSSFGLDISNLQSVKNLLLSLKNEKFDPKGILDKLKSIGDLQAQRTKLQEEVVATKEDLESKKSYLSEIKKLEGSSLNMEQVERLRNLVRKIASENKIEPSLAYDRFEQDILQSYNSVLGLKPEAQRLEDNRKRLEAEFVTRKKELESQELAAGDRIKKLEAKYSKQKDEIDAYSELRAQGVDGKRILLWDQIIRSANLDYGIIEGELRSQANLKNLEDKMSSKIKDLVAQEIKLNQSISDLDRDKEKIETSIQTVKESALKGIEELRSKTESSIESLRTGAEKSLADASRNSQRSLGDLTSSTQEQIGKISGTALSDLKTNVTEMKSSTEQFSRELKESIAQSSADIKNVGLALEAGEKIGKYRNIMPLLQLIDGSGTADESEALIAMWNLSSRFNAWLENHYPGEKKDISDPLTRLLESINNEIQRVGGD